MLISDFIGFARDSEKLDFSMGDKLYFIQPDYKNPGVAREFPYKYANFEVYEHENKQLVLKGTIEDVITYKFEGKYSWVDELIKSKQ